MTLWTPSSLTTLAGWWDASDSGSITNDGSGHASQWNDKSSNGNNLTPWSTGKPTINTASLNGLNALTFSANTGLQKLAASSLPSNATGIGFVALLLPSTTDPSNGANVFLSLGDHTNAANESCISFFNTNLYQLRTANDNAGEATVSFTDTTNPHIFSATCSTAQRAPFIDGTAGTAHSSSETTKSSTDIAIGHHLSQSSANDFVGKIYEVVLFSVSDSSTSDRQIIEGYAAWKWGLEADLPSGHPFKNGAPTIGGILPPPLFNTMAL